ncbi:class I SAM-dependent methyltransferase [Falsiroseomonas sp. E2-1-a20]|uniref:class I SAM-dependent methyltransferase n=1 Tax=Falsiroseomonas sp. E2-1-a20 TaxID=3239300 RepID=UPI003F3B2A7E
MITIRGDSAETPLGVRLAGGMMPQCPVCNATEFKPYNKRNNAVCAGCGAFERGRALMIYLKKSVKLPSEAVIYHFAPEKFLIDYFSSRWGNGYRCFDFQPLIYANDRVKMERFNLCADLGTLPDGSADLIIHNHVMEHIPCSVPDTLAGLGRKLKQGGRMIFTVPVFPGQGDEDLDPALTGPERLQRFGQADHMRSFGRETVANVIAVALGQNCLVQQPDFCSEQEAITAAVPWTPTSEPTGNSLFVYERP